MTAQLLSGFVELGGYYDTAAMFHRTPTMGFHPGF
jgi:hypothetical protein